MSRPAVSVVMPFAGDAAAAAAAIDALTALDTRDGDQLIFVDNSGVVPAATGVQVVRAVAEPSPAYARNAGAELAHAEWILFLDSDCRAPARLLDAFFERPVDAEVGALAGEVVPEAAGQTLASRYGAARSFLGQEAHIAHPYLPRAVAANLLVRRAAFEQVGGFYEGVRAAEDTDFSWRLQQGGWRLELRLEARVAHRYRATLRELRRQWRGYAAGRAWLGRRYEDFTPQPAVARIRTRAVSAVRRRGSTAPPRRATGPRGRAEAVGLLAIDGLLAADELWGLAQSNRPAAGEGSARAASVGVVLVAERFPSRADPLVDFARRLDRVRVEAAARPRAVDLDAGRLIAVDYREDDGAAARVAATVALAARHPLRCLRDQFRRMPGDPGLAALAPAVRRLRRDRMARVHPLGSGSAERSAARLARLSGRPLERDSR